MCVRFKDVRVNLAQLVIFARVMEIRDIPPKNVFCIDLMVGGLDLKFDLNPFLFVNFWSGVTSLTTSLPLDRTTVIVRDGNPSERSERTLLHRSSRSDAEQQSLRTSAPAFFYSIRAKPAST